MKPFPIVFHNSSCHCWCNGGQCLVIGSLSICRDAGRLSYTVPLNIPKDRKHSPQGDHVKHFKFRIFFLNQVYFHYFLLVFIFIFFCSLPLHLLKMARIPLSIDTLSVVVRCTTTTTHTVLFLNKGGFFCRTLYMESE
jgi:hypothetical protein